MFGKIDLFSLIVCIILIGGLVTKTTVEAIITEHAIAPLIANSGKGVAQISLLGLLTREMFNGGRHCEF